MRVGPPSCRLTLPVCLLLLTGAAAAQAPAQRSLAGFAKAEAALAAVENGLSQIEKSRKITEQFDPEAALDTSYRELRQAYDATMKSITEDAGKAGGAARAGRNLEAFERQVGTLRGRTEKVINRLTQINLDLRDASILIAPELLKKMPAEEVKELRQWLTPDAIRKYQALDKSLFAEGAAAFLPPPSVTTAMTTPGRCPACSSFARPRPREGAGSLIDVLDDLLVTDAEAALAVTCVGTCQASPPACLPCIGAAIGVTSFLAVQLDAGFKACDTRRTKLGRAICKAGLVLAFLTVIA